jgi:hypothetical protein
MMRSGRPDYISHTEGTLLTGHETFENRGLYELRGRASSQAPVLDDSPSLYSKQDPPIQRLT